VKNKKGMIKMMIIEKNIVKEFNFEPNQYYYKPIEFVNNILENSKQYENIKTMYNEKKLTILEISVIDLMLLRNSLARTVQNYTNGIVIGERLTEKRMLTILNKICSINERYYSIEIEESSLKTERSSRTLEWILTKEHHRVFFITETEQYVFITKRIILD
jgi:hypothetical protein